MAKKKITVPSARKQKRGKRIGVEVDKAAVTAATLGTFLLANEVSAAQDDKTLAQQLPAEQDLLQQAASELAAELETALDPAALSVEDFPELADAELLPEEELIELSELPSDLPAEDLDGMMLSEASPNVITEPGVDAKTVMNDGGGSAGASTGAETAAGAGTGTGAASGAAEAGAAAAGGAASSGLPGLAALSAIPAGVVAGVVGVVGVAAVASGGGGGGGDSFAGGATQSSGGRVVDGNVKGATIFYDANANGKLDAGEISSVTRDDGTYTLSGYTATDVGQIVVLAGGVDVLTGQTVGMMVTPHGYTDVNPLTTLLAASPGITEAQLKEKLGIPQSIDLNNYDPLADMKSGDPDKMAAAQKAFTVSQQVYAVLQTAAELKAKTGDGSLDSAEITDIAKKLAETIVNSSGADSTAILQEASQAAVTLAADGNEELANSVSAALTTVTSAIETSYQNLATALESGNAADIAAAVAVAAVSQSALVNAVKSDNGADTLALLSDQTSLSNLSDTYKSQLETSIANGGATAPVVVNLPSSGTIQQFIDGGLSSPYSIVDSYANIQAKLGQAVLNDALGVVVKSTTLSVADAKNLITSLSKVSFQNVSLSNPGPEVTFADAKLLAGKFLSFAANNSIQVTFDPDTDLADLKAFALKLGLANLHIIGSTTLEQNWTGSEAKALTDAGLIFADHDDVVVKIRTLADLKAAASYTNLAAKGINSVELLPTDGAALLAMASDSKFAEYITALRAAGATLNTIDVGASGTFNLSDAQASALAAAGLKFVDGDIVNVNVDPGSSTLTTTLKALQALNVDTVTAAAGVTAPLSISLGTTGTLNAAGSLPALPPDTTLVLASTQLNEVAGSSGVTALLSSHHITTINLSDNAATISLANAANLIGNPASSGDDISFHESDTVILQAGQSDVSQLADLAQQIHSLGIDTIDGGTLQLSDHQASELIEAGLSFQVDDTITVEGTSLSSSLKDLQKLGVDHIGLSGAGTDLEIALGVGGTLSAQNLPTFDDDLDVSLTLTSGQLGEITDSSGMVGALVGANVDQLDLSDNAASISQAQANALMGDLGTTDDDLVFADDDAITLDVSNINTVADRADQLAHIGVDSLNGGTLSISESNADALLGAELYFEDDDNITLQVGAGHGTHLENSLSDLKKLGVDHIAIAGSNAITVELGDAALAFGPGGLSTFDPSANVTLSFEKLQGSDVLDNADALKAAGIDQLYVSDSHHINLDLADLTQMLGSDLEYSTGDLSFSDLNDATLDVTDADLDVVLDHLGGLQGAGIDHLAAVGHIDINSSQAQALLAANFDFDDGSAGVDSVTLSTGTHVGTSLKDLQKLGVDNVLTAADALDIDLGGALALSGAHGLPLFGDSNHDGVVSTAEDDDLDVTLKLDKAQLGNLPFMANMLGDAGIDHLHINEGSIDIDLNQANSLHYGGHIDFTSETDVTLQVSADDLSMVAGNANAMGQQGLGVDTIDITDDAASISMNEAGDLYDAGIRFKLDDDLTVDLSDFELGDAVQHAAELHTLGIDHLNLSDVGTIDDAAAQTLLEHGLNFTADSDVNFHVDAGQGTHLSTTLKDLQKLGVDTVSVAAGITDLTIDLGAGAGFNLAGLPVFDNDLNVTLNVGANQLGQLSGKDLSSFGIDNVVVQGDADTLAGLNAGLVSSTGVDSFTMLVNQGRLNETLQEGVLPGLPSKAGVEVDKIDVVGFSGNASELHVNTLTAQAMVDAGLIFEGNDNITLDLSAGASGTHLATATDAETLHKLGIDEVTYHIGAPSDLMSLPTFDDELDVTLDLGNVIPGNLNNPQNLGNALKDKHYDAIQFNADINDLSGTLFDSIGSHANLLNYADAFEIELKVDLQGGAGPAHAKNLDDGLEAFYHDLGYTGSISDDYAALIEALTDSGITELVVETGAVTVSDELLGALAESGMLHAVANTNIAIDATGSGDFLHTTLKDMADLDVDRVDAATSGNLYINLGELGQNNVLAEVKAILAHLDPDMFNGATTPTLVLDAKSAAALSSGGSTLDASILEGLENIGIKEVAVLVGHNESTVVAQTPFTDGVAPAVKIIGQDADPMLFDELHHPKH